MTTLRRTIGLSQGVSLYVGAILGPGLLVLPGLAAEIAGPASLVAWAALAVMSVPMALTFAALARRYPEAGGFAAYIQRAFGPGLGALAGWLFYLSIPSGSAIVALIAGRYAANGLGLGREGIFLVGTAIVLAAYALNVVGLRLSARLQVLLSATLVIVLSVAIAGALPHVDPGAFQPFAPHGAAAVGMAAVALFWAFAGWEAITPLAEEFRNPARDIPRATWVALLIVGVVYLVLAVATLGTHAYGDALGTAPLAAMAGRSFGSAAELSVSVLAVFVSLGAINAYVAGASRLGYALGREGHVPRWFSSVHPRLGTPHHSLAFLFVGFLAWIGVAYVLGLNEAVLLPISTSSYIATYVLSMAAGVRLLTGRARGGAVAGTVACLLVLPFVGAVLAWVLGVTIAYLAYLAYRQFRRKGAAAPSGLRVDLSSGGPKVRRSGQLLRGAPVAERLQASDISGDRLGRQAPPKLEEPGPQLGRLNGVDRPRPTEPADRPEEAHPSDRYERGDGLRGLPNLRANVPQASSAVLPGPRDALSRHGGNVV